LLAITSRRCNSVFSRGNAVIRLATATAPALPLAARTASRDVVQLLGAGIDNRQVIRRTVGGGKKERRGEGQSRSRK